MSAQAEGDSATTRTPTYGAVSAQAGLVNGVVNGNGQHGPTGAPAVPSLENPNLGDAGQPVDRPGLPARPTTLPPPDSVDPPYGVEPHSAASVITPTEQREINGSRVFPSPQTPNGSMRVQEFFSARSQTSTAETQGARWMARFTEFLRHTASRGATSFDRVMDGLGLPHGAREAETTVAAVQYSFSPPESLPPAGVNVPAVPGSWTRATQAMVQDNQPLFGREELERMRRASLEYPLIYGRPQPSEGDSDRSSRLQAEVQRQLEEYRVRQREEVERLQREIQLLREERDRERRQEGSGDLQQQGASALAGNQGPLPQSASVPTGNPGLQPQSASVPAGNPGLQPQSASVPAGNPGLSVPRAVVSDVGPGILPPNPYLPQEAPQQLPQGQAYHDINRGHGMSASNCSGLPSSLNPSTTPPGLHPQSASVPAGNPGLHPQSASVPAGNPGLQPQSASVPAGNPGLQPQSASVPAGNPGQGQGGHNGIGLSTVTGQQWLAGNGPDRLAVLTDGMVQLQAAMLKQMDKKEDGERSPETVKPGTQALPSLKEVVADTACVDIMDWLEVIDGPMSDLSDSSAIWWRKVMSEANRAYGVWSLANPMDRLSVGPSTLDLEDGKFTRLNSRAAAMIVNSLHESVRQEVIARRLAGSTVRLVFRLLTLYQPGGEDEKFKILQNLQSPPAESDPARAVKALRSWSRWLRRCRELGVQAPDPSLLARGQQFGQGSAGQKSGRKLPYSPSQVDSAG